MNRVIGIGMYRKVFITFLVFAFLVSSIPLTEGYSNGIQNRSNGCSCHSQSGSTGATVGMSGLPSQYTAGSTTTLTISVSGGPSGSDGGFSLEVSQGSLSYMGFAVNVNSAGDSATHSITGSSQRSWSLDWTAPSSGSGTVTIAVAGMAADGNGYNSGDRWDTISFQVPESGGQTNTEPSVSNVLLGPIGATTNSQLSLSYSFSDADGDSESGSVIQWFKDGAEQSSLSGTSISSSLTVKNQQWYAIMTPSDGTDSGSPVTSNTLTVANSIPSTTAPSIQPTAPTVDDTLTFSSTASDADQDVVTIETRWFLEGNLVSELNDATELPSYATRDGDSWSVDVRVSDGEDVSQWVSSQAVLIGEGQVNSPPVISSLILSPSTPSTIDDVLLTYSYSDAEGEPEADLEVRWFLNNAAYDFAQNNLEIPSMFTAKGQEWYAEARVYDGSDWSTWASSPTLTIQNTPPVTGTVELSKAFASTTDSVSVTFDMSDADGDVEQQSSITWWRDGVMKSSLTGLSTLPATSTLKGEIWTVKVIAGDGQDLSFVEKSAQVSIINSPPSANVTLPESLSSLNQLTVSTSVEDVDFDTVELQLLWYRNGFLEGSLNGSNSVPSSLLGPGQIWSIHAVPTDSQGAVGPVAIASITVSNLDPIAAISIETNPVWEGESIILSSSPSSDADGRIVLSQWSWTTLDGLTGSSVGTEFSFIAQSNAIVTLTVIDDSGSSSSTTTQIVTVTGPSITSLEANVKGQSVELSWFWDESFGADFNVLRNGIIVATTNQTQFTDAPILAGNISYEIQPILDGSTLIAGASDAVEVTVSAEQSVASGTNASLGSISGIIFLLIGLIAAGYALKEERE